MLHILGRVKPFFRHDRVPAASERRNRVRLWPYLEALEDRTVLSTLIVDVGKACQKILPHRSGKEISAMSTLRDRRRWLQR